MRRSEKTLAQRQEPSRTGRGIPWSDEIRAEAISLATDVGPIAAADRLGVPESTVRNWVLYGGASTKQAKNLVQRDDTTKQYAIELAARIGTKRAAENIGMPRSTLQRWIREPGKKRVMPIYSAEQKAEAVSCAKEHSLGYAAQKFGISASAIYRWSRIACPESIRPPRPRRIYSTEDVTNAVNLARAIGRPAAADRLDIPLETLGNWLKKANGTHAKRRNRHYPKEFKLAALECARQSGHMQAMAEYSVSLRQLREWARAAGIAPPRIVGHTVGWDTNLGWLRRLSPEMEDWRGLAMEWINLQTESIGARLAALRILFKKYIHEQGLPTSPSELLSRLCQAPSPDSAFGPSRHGKVCRNYATDFIDWVLLTRFSTADAHGRVHTDPLFCNPLTRASFVGTSLGSESRFAALPYDFLVKCRKIIVQGVNFRDWVWAQRQLGVDEGEVGGVGPEWFEVPASLIDRDDPDCVWRRRLRSRAAGGARYEMWSPVRWVAQLVKVILPLRTLQVRLLDSGEADTWSYQVSNGVGSWTRNTSDLSLGTPARPVAHGVFRRPTQDIRDAGSDLPLGWANAVLYINTNKTADSKKSGDQKGYVLPWVNEGGVESDVFYWMHKLREWQKKYNPLSARTSWSQLDGRHMPKKSAVQLAGFPDACFLFRLPEERTRNKSLPVSDGMLDHTWYAVLSELERQLRAVGQTNIDGSPIQLVEPNSRAKRALFPPHSVRVSLVTAFADAGVPLTVLMRLVGHSRLAMTMYYRKRGETESVRHLNEAHERLRKEGASQLASWLKNAEHDALLQKAIGNNESALLGALPKNPATRNPAGWMPVSLGMCLVGGNVSYLEEAGASAGGCYNGGPNIGGPTKPKFAPVPGGAKNCVRCRWLATAPVYLPALVDHCNVQLYHFDQARRALLAADSRYQEAISEQIRIERGGDATLRPEQIEQAKAKVDTGLSRFNERVEDVIATLRLIERCRSALRRVDRKASSSSELLAVGGLADVEIALQKVPSEFDHVDRVCSAVEIYPEMSMPTAVLRRSQLMDAALMLDGANPVLVSLSVEDQLLVGNELMRRLACSVDPSDPTAGRRKVVEIIDARELLSKHLHISVDELTGGLQKERITRLLPIR